MYENPQYLTPNGYQRFTKNPYGNKSVKKEVSALLAARNHKTDSSKSGEKKLSSQTLHHGRISGKQPQTSDKAAKLIALAIKDLLRNK